MLYLNDRITGNDYDLNKEQNISGSLSQFLAIMVIIIMVRYFFRQFHRNPIASIKMAPGGSSKKGVRR